MPPKPARPPSCTIDGCERPQHPASYLGNTCFAHRTVGRPQAETCELPGCNARARRGGRTCSVHTLRQVRAVEQEQQPAA
jgi:hypothetical protein